MAGRYRKKPVVITAVQFRGNVATKNELYELAGDAVLVHLGAVPQFSVVTPEGVMTGFEDWWLIQGVAGEFYPCKPEIFAATYDYEGEVP